MKVTKTVIIKDARANATRARKKYIVHYLQLAIYLSKL